MAEHDPIEVVVREVVVGGWLRFAKVEDYRELAIWHQERDAGYPGRTSHISINSAKALVRELKKLIAQIEARQEDG